MVKKGILSALILGAVISLLFIGFSFTGLFFFESIDRSIYDFLIRLSLGEDKGLSKVALIEIDDRSIEKLGAWPWPRHVISDMMEKLQKSRASLIGLYIPLLEKEPNPGLFWVVECHILPRAFPPDEDQYPGT